MERPKQRIHSSKKNKEWVIKSAKYFSSMCKDVIDSKEADILYRAANGELREADYTHVTNPYNSKDPKLTRFPVKIKNFDIISTNLVTLLGEKRKRGLKYTSIAINADIESQKKNLHNQLVERYLTEQLIAQLAQEAEQSGEEFDIEAVQTLSAEEIKKRVENISDKASINAQVATDYIVQFNSFDKTNIEGWYHFLATGFVFSYKTVNKDEVIHEIVPPREMSIYASSRDRFINSCEAVKRKYKMTISEVIDKFQGMKDAKKMIDELEGQISSVGSGETAEKFHGMSEIDGGKQEQFGHLWNKIQDRRGDSKIYNDDEGFLVEHLVWTSSTKVGRISSISPLGDVIEIDVDDTYVPLEGEDVNWRWVDEKREVWIVEDKWYIGGDPIYLQVGDYDSPHKVENPYNGLIQRMLHTTPISMVKRGIDYQIKYNIIHFYIEKAMAKNMGKITLLPIGLIPKKKGFNTETTMYYANALGFMFIDETNPKFANAVQAVKVLDADLGNYISQHYQYLEAIKAEWDNLIGMTPPRKGQMNSSDGKAVQENAIFRSSIMTEEWFSEYEEFEETDLNGCLELSKYAFINGKKTMFLDPDLKEAMINIDGQDFSYWNYLVKISNSGKDLQALEQAKSQAQAFAQNQMRPSKVLKLIRTNNLSGLIQEMESLEEELDKKMQASEQAERESREKIEASKEKVAQLNYDAKIYASDKSKEASIEVATINAEKQLGSDMFNATGGEDEIKQLNDNINKRQELQDKKDLEREKLALENKKVEMDSDTKKYVADTNYAIAKENKN